MSQSLQGLHIPEGQLFPLELCDPSNERKVVVRPSLSIADLPPSAHFTVLRRFRISRNNVGTPIDTLLKPVFDKAVIRLKICYPVGIGLKVYAWANHIHPLW